MPAKIDVVWSTPVDESVKIAGRNKILEMGNLQVKEDETSYDTYYTQVTRTRYWIDEATANVWADFVRPMGPVSITITPY
jgi:hypothetical protein